jgi:hypothetical protein
MVTRLPARFHMVTALPVRAICPSRNAGRNTLIWAGRFAGPFLPARRLLLRQRLDGRGSVLPSAIKLRNVLDCQAKILEAVGRRW